MRRMLSRYPGAAGRGLSQLARRDGAAGDSTAEALRLRHVSVAANYDELIDHPVEIGDFALGTFKAHGVQHDIVITGRVPNLDMARLRGRPEESLRSADRAFRAAHEARAGAIATCS